MRVEFPAPDGLRISSLCFLKERVCGNGMRWTKRKEGPSYYSGRYAVKNRKDQEIAIKARDWKVEEESKKHDE